ncbi:hypothetical protein HQQ86_15240 [Rathayibacter sp. VKM Ac-2857]|nr:hypothetical protein [Rathayibacter sp. VKM Ac-2857]
MQRGISGPRFQTFLAAASGDAELARELYVWNRDVSVAILGDIAILEVALRNAMHDAATRAWGPHWYADPSVLLDERSSGQLASAWQFLHESVKKRAQDVDVPGRVVAQCMFGFWTNLLDAGGHIGRPPRRVSADYDKLWDQAFRSAFPGGRIEARTQRNALIQAIPPGPSQQKEVIRMRQEVAFNRNWIHGVCKTVNELRNRVAHHEPILNGFPLKGQQNRMTTEAGHEQIRMLARMLDAPLATWLDGNSPVPALLARRPQ